MRPRVLVKKRFSEYVAKTCLLSSFQVMNAIPVKAVIKVLNRNKISFVLVGGACHLRVDQIVPSNRRCGCYRGSSSPEEGGASLAEALSATGVRGPGSRCSAEGQDNEGCRYRCHED